MPPVVLPPPIAQEDPSPTSSEEVIDLLTRLVVNITSLQTNLVRPRWQPTPPEQPPVNVTWAAVGVVGRSAQGFNYQGMSNLPGTNIEALLQRRWASFEVLVSFYGPNSDDISEQFRDGVQIVQNLAGLYSAGIKITSVDSILKVPDLVNLQWIDHNDIRLELVREFDRYYPMKSVIEANGSLVTDVNYTEIIDSNKHVIKS